MNVQALLDKIEDIIATGSKIPLSNKVAVDADAIKQCIEDIRYDLPIEIDKAREIVAHHNNLITKANNEATSIVSTAQGDADSMVGKAKDKAAGIVATAESNAKNTLETASKQARKMVEDAEVTKMAQKYADEIRAKAEAEAQNIVNNAKAQADAIVLDGNNRARETCEKADKWSADIRNGATEFVDGIMRKTDSVLSESLTEVRKAHQSLFGNK